jgi:hypothetical protein
MGVTKEFKSPADRAAYVAKFNKKAMDVVAKIDAVINAVEKAKTAVSAKTPTVYSKASVEKFEAQRMRAMKALGYLDISVAQAKTAAKQAAAKIKL